jgi:hypothetical protein
MEEIKKQIIDIIRGYQEDERSSTGITGEKIIYGFSDESIVEDIVNLIQTIFDPENQPNQLGIENPFKQQGYSEEEVEDLIYKVCGTVARLQGIILNGNHLDTAYKQYKKK